jgi:phenylacetate-CoA ligase
MAAMIESLHRYVLVPAFESGWHRRDTFCILRGLERSQWETTDELERRQVAAARELLKHAAATCPYYAAEWGRLGLDPTRIESINDLQFCPLIDRDTIRIHRSAMRSHRADLRTFSKATGGSSGMPLQFDVDHESNNHKMAAWHRGYAWAGAGVGTKQFYLWGVPLGKQPAWKNWKHALYHWLYRHKVVSCFGLTEDRVDWYLRELNGYQPEVIVAYTNPLYCFARMLADRGLKSWRPQSIVVGAEKLHDFQRELIEQVFQAPVFETYGSREFMLIGAECPEHAGLHLTMENMIVEIVDDEGQPTPPGEEGNVVITDLTNRALPFIRYLNGDRAIAGFETCRCGRGLPLLKQVVGRRLDVLRTPDGRMVPGEFFPHLMKDYAAVRRFQVVQPVLDQVELRIVRSEPWGAGEQQSLVERVHAVLGDCVEMRVAEVDDIPLTGAGKLRVVVSHCVDAGFPSAVP